MRIAEARRRYLAGKIGLRTYLTVKARAGVFDERMCRYYDVDPNVVPAAKKAICRAYAIGLVPTDTLRPVGSSGSFHAQRDQQGRGRGVDFGLRRNLIGTRRGLRRMQRFQRAEHRKAEKGKINPIELIGPDNEATILRGGQTDLAEGTPLETQHDDHVHLAF